MDEIYMNMDFMKSGSSRPTTDQTGPRSSVGRLHRAAGLSLGLLTVFLLAGLIGLGVHHCKSVSAAAAELSALKANLTGLLQASDTRLSSLTEETTRSQTSSGHAQGKVLSTVHSYYFLSAESGSWRRGSEDCRQRGADLVVIDSAEEQVFLSEFIKVGAWIGLNDTDEEGTWKWVSGAPLTVRFWANKQPDNAGEEDCVQVIASTAEWNDLPCERSLHWICEKVSKYG